MEAIKYSCNPEGESNPHTQRVSQLSIAMQDLVLTPFTCATIVVEILKVLLYEKSQLPYPYTWLKNAISKRKPTPNIHSHNTSVIIQKYFNLAQNTFSSIEDIAFHLHTLLSTTSVSQVQEIVILFGSTPYTPREVFTIRFPKIAKGHLESNHKPNLQKKLHNVLKKLFLSDEWLNAMQHQLPITNVFVMVKKTGVLRHEHAFFEHYSNFMIPPNIRHTIITLKYDAKYDECCSHLHVWGDENEKVKALTALIQSRTVDWYQAKSIIKGYQDFYIDKVSVSELW